MASINDVFNELQQVNSNLGLIHADGIAQTNATTQVKTSVDTLDGDVKAGFAATVIGLQIIAKIDIEAVKLLFHLTQQADSMICALEHISKNTCGILTQSTIQTKLQTEMRDDLDVMRDVAEATNPGAALDRARLDKLRAQVERCCPPQTPPPACTYAPCLSPKPVGMPDLPRVDPQQPTPVG
jgi:hypothetical protein